MQPARVVLAMDSRPPPWVHCSSFASGLAHLFELAGDGIHDSPKALLHRGGGVGIVAGHAWDLLAVVRHLALRELEAMGCGDDDCAIAGRNDAPFSQLDQGCQGHACVWAVEHACTQAPRLRTSLQHHAAW